MRIATLAAALAAAISTSARAEFTLQATPSAPSHVQREMMPMARRLPLPVQQPPPPKPIAPGFGHDVPLAFAVKQILPEGVQPQMGQSVDPDAKISWTGGRPWDVVLSEAVKPLGIKLQATKASALLTR